MRRIYRYAIPAAVAVLLLLAAIECMGQALTAQANEQIEEASIANLSVV